ncbi:hypothetical protein A3A48_04120 [Candidatus Curtissbacteria bacterium RIFCSPLOWO2_01_FULL_37_9]|nr:MAG: hypothetical protein A3A48_04120 [Candidatus Curtissbacteria bacterium RIFCSPLOWO2_01_FULL_37_9]
MSVSKKSVLNVLSKIHKKSRKRRIIASDIFFVGEDDDEPVGKMTDLLASVNPNSSDSKDNEHSISDGLGGRIELEFDDESTKQK